MDNKTQEYYAAINDRLNLIREHPELKGLIAKLGTIFKGTHIQIAAIKIAQEEDSSRRRQLSGESENNHKLCTRG